ncbi:MAG: lipopolysaccharide biosynthesis protein [Tannerella sp.]|jgi:O-antigen/teichoic acid export membrane protein|nr:lipopolysaccharide biosynthesis protein [Tannerella sp.]
MWRKIIETVGTRYFVALLNLLLIFVHAKALGPGGMGLIGVLYASANIAFVFNSILCGNTIIYFLHRYHSHYVFWPAYFWAFAGSAIACAVMTLTRTIPEGYGAAVYTLAVLLSLVAVHARMLLGRDRIRAFNLTHILQGAMLFPAVLYLYYVADRRNAGGYLCALFIANGLAWAVSLVMLARPGRRPPPSAVRRPRSTLRLMREMFVYGLWSSADNLAENLTVRLNYFLLQRMGGYAQVGMLDAGTKIAESVWHISRSIGFISYSEVAKTSDADTQRQITLRLFKLTFCTITLLLLAIGFIPERIYTDYLFTPEFRGIRRLIHTLSPGILAFGANTILSHHFIGTGRVKYSAACSGIGLLVLLAAGATLIPAAGIFGAALSTSIAFVAMLAFSLTVFVRLTRTPLHELLPEKNDLRHITRHLRHVVNDERHAR